MGSVVLGPDRIGTVIAEYIEKPLTVFVFPTGITADLWADWTIRNSRITGTTVVATERFTAWDVFKSASIKTTKEGMTSIPSVMRKIFAADLISRNAAAARNGTPIFQSIINPVYADTASSFTDWIAGLLPSLALWKEKFDRSDKTVQLNSAEDSENADFLELYEHYKTFLDAQGFYDPAWERPPFKSDGKKYLIFYPEILEDYADYRELLESAEDITLVMLPPAPEKEKHPEVSFFANARTELRITALKILELHDNGADWTDIAVSVPDLADCSPYVEREMSLYRIPFVKRAGEALTANSAGQIFGEIRDCVRGNFSYASIRTLLLDHFVPWKDEAMNESLVRFGSENACLIGYTDDNGDPTDSWEKSFSESSGTEREYTMYRMLKRDLKDLVNAKTFSKIQTAWFTFRTHFLDTEAFSDEANRILGRCLSELSSLIEIEKKFMQQTELRVPSPFDFFVSELDEKLYVPQRETDGVSLFPYRLSAVCPFPHQLITNAGQQSLTVPYKPLPFLREDKRRALHIEDYEKASDAFVRLYAKTDCVFSCAYQTFSGYAVPYSYLNRSSENTDATLAAAEKELSRYDFVSQEKNFLAEDEHLFPQPAADYQKDGFLNWAGQNDAAPGSDESNQREPAHTAAAVSHNIRDLFYYTSAAGKRTHTEQDSLHLSETDMNYFFTCPQKWLFARVLQLREDSLETELVDRYAIGDLQHKIMELYLRSLKDRNKLIPSLADENDPEFMSLSENIDSFFDAAVAGYRKTPLVHTVLVSEKTTICRTMKAFLKEFSAFFAGFNVVEAEASYQTASPDNTFFYTGRIDCVLGGQHGEVTIVDFKKSSTPAAAACIADENGNLTNFQIAMYTYLWNSVHEKSQQVQNALFFNITKANPTIIFGRLQKAGTVKKGKLPDSEAFEPTLELFRSYAERFADRIRRNDFLKTNGVRFKTCTDCRFSTICRTTYHVSGNRNAQ